MPRMTLLSMVQELMSTAGDFNVNSINDLEQSLQVAQIIKTEYNTLLDSRDWSFLKGIHKLESLSDTDQPTKLKIPDNIDKIVNFSYNITLSSDTRSRQRDLCFMEPSDFMSASLDLDDSASNVVSKTDSTSGIILRFYNDRMPSKYTTFDNRYIYLDSYNVDEESTVQGSKTIVNTIIKPEFEMSDTFIPQLPENMFSLLLEQSRMAANYYLREMGDELAQKKTMLLFNNAKIKEVKKDGGRRYANYSRKR